MGDAVLKIIAAITLFAAACFFVAGFLVLCAVLDLLNSGALLATIVEAMG